MKECCHSVLGEPSECRLWGGAKWGLGAREEAAARVHVSMGLRPMALCCAEPSTEPGSGGHPW